MSQDRLDRMRENFLRQGGRPARRTRAVPADPPPSEGPGKRADERVVSLPLGELLPDRYQGRLRWPLELDDLERLYRGEWDAPALLDHIDAVRARGANPALDEAWGQTLELARSILAEGQIAPVTVAPDRSLPAPYRYVIETGEGRFWAYHLMGWLLEREPGMLGLAPPDWQEDPGFIRAIVVSAPSRLRQVAENEQRQSYPSAVDRAVAYASMLAEEASYEVAGAPPGIRGGRLELPEAYWRAARRGLRGRRGLVEQLPTGRRQVQRHLKLLTDLDPWVLAQAKQHGLTEAQLRPLVGRDGEEQRQMVELIIERALSSREAAAAGELLADDGGLSEQELLARLRGDSGRRRGPLTIPEESARLVRSLASAARRYDALRRRVGNDQLAALLEAELAATDTTASGRPRRNSPRRRLAALRRLLESLDL